jgi:CspA family cold shock protein
MAELHVETALRAKRAEISGHVHNLERKLGRHRASLANIDATIRLYAPELDPDSIPPKRTYRRTRYFATRTRALLALSGRVRKAIVELQQRGSRMALGTVKWFNSQKGYGFIQPQAAGKDVFVHISAVEKAGLSGLNEGQVVEYEEVSDRGKTSAGNLKVQR